ncbi:MAG: glycosyltransferase family 4 protein [Bryobacteraceae bacterium]|jgi:glycosyltransferase involved in cell wall biosynthesis
MRLLLLITRAELGGGQTHVLDLLRGFRERFDVELGTGERGFLTEAAAQMGIRWHLLPHLVQPMNPWRDARALLECHRLIRAVRPDIVHTHTSKAGVIGRAAAHLAGVPSVFTAHTWCFAEATSWKWKAVGIPLEWMAARCASRIITVSDANRTLALRHHITGPEKLVTVHNGIADCPHRARPASGAPPRIVMVARFSEQKAQSLLIDAVAGIRQPFHLLLVGDGPARPAVEAQVEQHGLGHRVEFAGNRLDVPEILAASHIFALFTKWEGFPISILEAMRAGLPVVASDVNGVREAVSDGSTGFAVPPGDVAAFRQRLELLLQDASLRERMGAASRRRFVQEFTVGRMLQRVAEVYRAALWPRLESLTAGAPAPAHRTPSA